MVITPDKKLFTKLIMTQLAISLTIIIIGFALHTLIPLKGKHLADEVGQIVWSIVGGTLTTMWIFSTPIMYIWIKNLEYEIDEEKVIIHKGIISKTEKNIPFRAITDFVLYRSLFDRILNIASIRVQTAGQSATATGYEGNLTGILKWKETHMLLKEKLSKIHGGSVAVAGQEEIIEKGTEGVLRSILEEVRELRRILESK